MKNGGPAPGIRLFRVVATSIPPSYAEAGGFWGGGQGPPACSLAHRRAAGRPAAGPAFAAALLLQQTRGRPSSGPGAGTGKEAGPLAPLPGSLTSAAHRCAAVLYSDSR